MCLKRFIELNQMRLNLNAAPLRFVKLITVIIHLRFCQSGNSQNDETAKMREEPVLSILAILDQLAFYFGLYCNSNVENN